MPFDPILGAGYTPSSIGGPTTYDTGAPNNEDLIPGTTDTYDLDMTKYERLVAIMVNISSNTTAGVAGDIKCTASLYVDGELIASWSLPNTRDSWFNGPINEIIAQNKVGAQKVRLQFVTESGGTGYNVYVRLRAVTLPI